MYIESLHVENVGPFSRLNVSFNPMMNVVVGVNGVGKTSLLRCIAYCMTNFHMEHIRLRKDAMLKLNCRLGTKGVTYGADQLVSNDQEYQKFKDAKWKITPKEGYEKRMLYEDKNYNLLAIGAYRHFSYKRIDGIQRESPAKERRQPQGAV